MSGSSSFLGDNQRNAVAPHFYTHAEILDIAFPYYLSIGMTPAEYWDGENELKPAYREAHKMKVRDRNFEQWLHGKYVYDALCRVSPLFNALSKKKEPIPYLEEPYPIYDEDRKRKKEEENKRLYEKKLADMKSKAERRNKYLKNKRGG